VSGKMGSLQAIYTTFIATYPDDLKACQLYALFLARRKRTDEYLQVMMKAGSLLKMKKNQD